MTLISSSPSLQNVPLVSSVRATTLVLALLLSGCATYRGLPLPTQDSLLADATRLEVDVGTMPTPDLRSHRFEPGDGLDITEVAMLAVANNPDLKLLRAEAGITRAQAFSAGLLPDPQLALTSDQVLGSLPGSTVAWTAGLTMDVGALLARSSTRAAADAESRKSNLNLLWQEWQAVAKARLLFVKLDAIDRSIDLLDRHRAPLQDRLDRTRTAVQRGLMTSDAATPQLTALQDANRQRNDLERQRNQAGHDLNALLGVDPKVQLALVGPPQIDAPDEARVQSALDRAPQRRPDLLALRAGYEAQDDRYRGALRAQFPAITLGPTRARDTSNVNTSGLSLGITLPLFNRNRGNIAIELATREKMQLEYQQRLDAATSDAHRLVAEQTILVRQRVEIDIAVDELARNAERTSNAFAARSIDALTLTNAEGAVLAKQLERIAVDQALWEQAIALHALTGLDLNASEAERRTSASTPAVSTQPKLPSPS
jgi:outer membrane protein TolC